jgi:two-component system NtrC family sensor kinase
MVRQSRILIVDDDVNTADYIGDLLQAQGYSTDWAFDGREALGQLRSTPPEAAGIEQAFDLVILDVMMPGIDGYEVCRRIKSDEGLHHVSVIMVTGLGSTVNKTKGLELGADDYITKPFTPEELVARVKAVLRMRAMDRDLVQRNRELAALNEIARLTSHTLDLDQVLATTLNQALNLMSGQTAIAALIEEDDQRIRLHMHRGLPSPLNGHFDGLHWANGDGLVGGVVRSGETRVINDLSVDPHLAQLAPHGIDVAACAPLTAQHGIVGALVVAAEGDMRWGDHTVRLLEAVGAQVGVAIENARLYTRISQYAEELARSQAQLIQAEKLAAMGRLTASIAHELNNPLQAIQNCLHLILHRSLEEEKQRKYLTMAQEEVERLITTVQRMLDFYRPSTKQQRATDVHQVIDDVLALTSKRLERGHVRVHRVFDSRVPPLSAIGNQLKQVFLNLVVNAVEAMPKGGELTIRTSLSADGRWVSIAFYDQGLGLSQQARAHLFEPFYTTKSKGTGLGLSVSYGIVEQHGGTIEVESTEDKGSCFTIRLPTGPIAS